MNSSAMMKAAVAAAMMTTINDAPASTTTAFDQQKDGRNQYSSNQRGSPINILGKRKRSRHCEWTAVEAFALLVRGIPVDDDDDSIKRPRLVTPSTPSSSGREDRLRKQVAELEDKVVTLEKEARALKRNADKATRLEKEMAEAEEREKRIC
jgi:hypothetical protein